MKFLLVLVLLLLLKSEEWFGAQFLGVCSRSQTSIPLDWIKREQGWFKLDVSGERALRLGKLGLVVCLGTKMV